MSSGAEHGIPMWTTFPFDTGVSRNPFFTEIRADYVTAEDAQKESDVHRRTVNISET